MNLKSLRAIAEAATPGRWEARNLGPRPEDGRLSLPNYALEVNETHDTSGMVGAGIITHSSYTFAYPKCSHEDAEHIATFSPSTVLELLYLLETGAAALNMVSNHKDHKVCESCVKNAEQWLAKYAKDHEA